MTARLIRLCALACFASAACAAGALVGFAVVAGTKPIGEAARSGAFFLPTGLALAAIVLLGLGLVGLYLWQAPRMGAMGLVGFVLALVGTMLGAGGYWTYVFVLPYFAGIDPTLVNSGSGSVLVGFVLSFAVMAGGWTVFGAATLRAGMVGRGASIFLIVGAVVAILPLPSRTLLLSCAAALIGRRMLREPARGSDGPAALLRTVARHER